MKVAVLNSVSGLGLIVLAPAAWADTRWFEEPGPACAGAVMSIERLAELAWGDVTRFEYPVSGSGVRVSSVTHANATRECTSRSSHLTCTPWAETASGPSSYGDDEGFYLGAADGRFTAAVYHSVRGRVEVTHDMHDSYASGGVVAKDLSLTDLIYFKTGKYKAHSSIEGTSLSDSFEGPEMTGKVRSHCAKFWSIEEVRRTDFGGIVKSVENARVILAEY